MLRTVELVAAALLVAKCATDLLLAALNRREILRHAGTVPAAYADTIDAPTHARAVEYSIAKNRFGQVEDLFGAAVLAGLVFSGVLPWSWSAWTGWGGLATWSQALWLVAVGLALAVPSLPFEWWSTFRLEARFGFNKSTVGLWLGDKVKGALVALALGVPLLWLLLSLVGWMGRWWWVWGFGAVMVFQLLMIVLYPLLILPLFNKLTPLPEGELRSELLALADRAGFKARTIEVMDGSKRSGHSNAFFTGFGRFRRIVLFDTLIAQLGRDELAAVLAHEIGHYKRGHIPRMLALSAAFLAAGFFTIDWLMRSAWFLDGFGFVPTAGAAPALLLVTLLGGLATYWLSPLLNGLSRKHEYEADAFARAALGGPAPLVGALRKLAEKNLTNLTPHPWFSTFHYSHPTLLERERALVADAS
jgi:STE24 endopeptidase